MSGMVVLSNQCPWCRSTFQNHEGAKRHVAHMFESANCFVDRSVYPVVPITPDVLLCPLCAIERAAHGETFLRSSVCLSATSGAHVPHNPPGDIQHPEHLSSDRIWMHQFLRINSVNMGLVAQLV